MSKICVVLLLVVATPMSAQVVQSGRWEKEQKNSSHTFTVIPMYESGVAMVNDKQKYEGGKKFWDVIALDTLLQEKWTREIFVDNRYNFIGHDFRDGFLFFLFRLGETDLGDLKILKLGLQDGMVETHNYEPQLGIKLTHFNVMENKAILAGYLNNEPAILLYDLSADQGKIVPGLFVKNTHLLDLRVNTNNTFNVLLSESPSKLKKKLVLKTFDHTGALLLDDAIEIESEKTILSGVTSTLVRDELLIAGTWTEGVGQQAAGIFSVLVDPYNDQKINYYDFAQLPNFLNYLSPKRMAKIKAKADSKRTAGKIPDFRANVNSIRIEETKEGFLFFNETYYTSTSLNNNRFNNSPYYSQYPYGYGFGSPYRLYNSPYYNPYSAFGNTNPSVEVKMLNASVILFDAKGAMLADHGAKLDEIKTTSSEQISDFVWKAGKITMVACKEKEVTWQVTQSDGVSLINEKKSIELSSSVETIRSEEGDVMVRYWYGKQLFLYGYQTIKNSEKGNRDVFFINKLSVE
jgi:hypothetical protein